MMNPRESAVPLRSGAGGNGAHPDPRRLLEESAPDGPWAEGWRDDFAYLPDEEPGAVTGASLSEALSPQEREMLGLLEEAPGESGFSPLDLQDRVVIMLLFRQLLRVEDIEEAWTRWTKVERRNPNEQFWRFLAQYDERNRETIYAEAAKVYGFRSVILSKRNVEAFLRKVRTVFTEAQWKRLSGLNVLPIAQEQDGHARKWTFVTHDPARSEVNRFVKGIVTDPFELCHAPRAVISQLFADFVPRRNEYLERMRKKPIAQDLGVNHPAEKQLLDEKSLEEEINRSSLVNLFEATLVEAVQAGASDIHVFPDAQKRISIHFRIDGELTRWLVEDQAHPDAFIAVVKDNALNVDRFEREAGQDGFIQRTIDGRIIRFRVSVLPIANVNPEIRSESIVIRILDDRQVPADLRLLGLQKRALEHFEWAIRQPDGMVIMTGPTGSGKTTTLLAALRQVATPKRNVLTVEDPVEYVVPELRQVKLSHKLTLDQAMRFILRHDPDVVMVGEMRDRETAELAVQLAQTGRLTFSTLHTNDAVSAISRLYKMGIEPFLLAYTIRIVAAQRLVRRLCKNCRVPDEEASPVLLRRLGFEPSEVNHRFYRPGEQQSCTFCKGSGHSGRMALTETLVFSGRIRQIILAGEHRFPEAAVREQALREGMTTLQDAAREAAKAGDISLTEVVRMVSFDLASPSGAEEDLV